MDLLGSLAGKLAGGSASGGSGQQIIMAVLEMLNNREGGISGLASAFQQNGLGDVVSSWIGTGQNLPISADLLQRVLGQEQVKNIARQAGISTDAAGSQLADLLPGIVDKLTPGGQVPQGDLMSAGLSILQELMSGGKQG